MNNNNYKNNLIKKLKTKKAIIGVIGLGYVGLPLAILFAKKKFKVFGFDIDKNKIRKIKQKKSYIGKISSKDISLLTKSIAMILKFQVKSPFPKLAGWSATQKSG